MNRILIIEDDPDIALSIKYHMEKQGGFNVVVAENGEQGLEAALRDIPDLVLLDLNLPGIDGMEVCRALRERIETGSVPIIMLTARVDEQDTITGLNSGADDYITKPFSVKEVVARVRAVLRRVDTPTEEPQRLAAGSILLDEARRTVHVDEQEISLTRKEFDLLAELMRRRGLVLSREKLLERVWGYRHPGETRTVDVHVRQLRKKLGTEAAKLIETVVGVGYRLRSETP
jgi:two-component system alkaline phosphatase synthesis response regulator PhoP